MKKKNVRLLKQGDKAYKDLCFPVHHEIISGVHIYPNSSVYGYLTFHWSVTQQIECYWLISKISWSSNQNKRSYLSAVFLAALLSLSGITFLALRFHVCWRPLRYCPQRCVNHRASPNATHEPSWSRITPPSVAAPVALHLAQSVLTLSRPHAGFSQQITLSIRCFGATTFESLDWLPKSVS